MSQPLDYSELRRRVFFYFLRRAMSWQDAEDLAQIAMLTILQSGHLQERAREYPNVVFGIGRTLLLSRSERRSRRRERALVEEPADMYDQDDMTDERRARIERVEAAFSRIRPKWQHQIQSIYDEVPAPEAARQDGVSVCTVKNRRDWALIAMRRQLVARAG